MAEELRAPFPGDGCGLAPIGVLLVPSGLLVTAGAIAFAGGTDGASPGIRPMVCWARYRATDARAEGLATMCAALRSRAALRHGMEAQRGIAAV